MAECSTCNHHVAYNARICPKCGRQLPTQQIVSIGTWAFVGLIFVLLVLAFN